MKACAPDNVLRPAARGECDGLLESGKDVLRYRSSQRGSRLERRRVRHFQRVEVWWWNTAALVSRLPSQFRTPEVRLRNEPGLEKGKHHVEEKDPPS